MKKPDMLCVKEVSLLLQGWIVRVFFSFFKNSHNVGAGRALGRQDQKQEAGLTATLSTLITVPPTRQSCAVNNAKTNF